MEPEKHACLRVLLSHHPTIVLVGATIGRPKRNIILKSNIRAANGRPYILYPERNSLWNPENTRVCVCRQVRFAQKAGCIF